ncbi:MAG: PAS domain-containing protein [Chloroflexi bacterium]|nr:PAS domain-containing protein [Chloroflexota bacterium]
MTDTDPQNQSRPEFPQFHPLETFGSSSLDSLPAGVIIIDRHYRLMLANKFTQNWVKRSLEEILGERCFRLFHQTDDICPDCPSRVTFETGQSTTITHAGLDRGGKPTYTELTTFPLRDSAGQVVQVIEYARDVSEKVYFQQSILQLNARLSALNAIASIVSSSLDLDEILHLVSAKIMEVTGSDGAAVGLWEKDGNWLITKAQVGYPTAFWTTGNSGRVKIRGSLSEFEARAGTPEHFADLVENPAQTVYRLREEGIRFVALAPIRSKERTMGLLASGRRGDEPYSSQDLDFLAAVGSQISVAVENTRLFQRLRESEATYRNMVECSNDLIWTLDEKGDFTWFNRQAEELTGHRLYDWIGKSFVPLVAPEDLPKVQRIFSETLAGDSPSYEVRVLKKNGGSRVLLVNTTPVFAGSSVVGTISFGKDITDSKRAEEELLQRNCQLAALNDLSFAVNQSLDLGEVLQRALGKSMEALHLDSGGIYLLEDEEMVLTVHSGLSARFVEAMSRVPLDEVPLQEVIASQRPLALQTRLDASMLIAESLRQDGLRSVLRVPLLAAQGVLGVMNLYSRKERIFTPEELEFATSVGNQVGVAIENARLYRRTDEQLQETIEELARALEDAERERAKAQMVTMVSGDAIMVVDAHRRIVNVNPALEALTGHDASEFLGRPCYRFLNVRDKDGISLCDTACPFVSSGPRRSVPLEVLISGAAPADIWTELTMGCTADDLGRPQVVVHTFRDLAKRKEVDRLKDEFLAVATHELKTPITSIRAYAQTMLRQLKANGGLHGLDPAADPTPQQDHERKLEGLLSQIDRLTNLVDELLDVSRVQSGRLELRKSPADLTDLLASVAERARLTTDKHVIVLDVPKDRPSLYIDSSRIEQVVTNLIENAVKYSPAGGRIEIRMSVSEEVVQVSVADEGIGIPVEQRPHVFDRFFQVANRVSHQHKGLGLGLYISREIVERHGGRVSVDGREDGGSIFSFTLRLDRGENITVNPSEARDSYLNA